MKSPSENSAFDYKDQQVASALNDVPVPPGAKQRASQRLALFAMEAAQEATHDSVRPVGVSGDSGVSVAVAASSVAVDGIVDVAGRGSWIQTHRSRVIAFFVAASLLLAAGVYFSRPLDQQQLMAVCSLSLDARLQDRPNWQAADPGDLRGLLDSIGLSQLPASIRQVELNDPPLGRTGQLWKLTFENREDLYVFELHQASAISGVGQVVGILPSSSNSWMMAASQNSQRLLVCMTKGNLNQYLRLIPLA